MCRYTFLYIQEIDHKFYSCPYFLVSDVINTSKQCFSSDWVLPIGETHISKILNPVMFNITLKCTQFEEHFLGKEELV